MRKLYAAILKVHAFLLRRLAITVAYTPIVKTPSSYAWALSRNNYVSL